MSVRRVSAREAKALLDAGYVFVDVRTEAEFAAGHAVGAVNVPYAFAGPSGTTPNPDFVDLCARLWGKDTPLVVGCKSGVRSLAAAELLVAAGHTDVVELRPGWDGLRGPFGQLTEKGWVGEGLPVERGAGAGSFESMKARAG